jgi:hypothetical protein
MILDINGNNTTNNNNRDGIATFDLTLSSHNTGISTYYRHIQYQLLQNRPDALAELNVITNITNYRNIGYRILKTFVRVESNLDNSCFALGPF